MEISIGSKPVEEYNTDKLEYREFPGMPNKKIPIIKRPASPFGAVWRAYTFTLSVAFAPTGNVFFPSGRFLKNTATITASIRIKMVSA